MKSHRFKIIALAIGLCIGIAFAAFAAAPAAKPVAPGVSQGPMKAGNVCVTKTIHNAGNIQTFNLYTSKVWYGKADWKVVNSATGADFVVQRKLGNNTTGTPGSSGSLAVNREYTSYTLATFGTATSASITACQDRQ